VSEVASHTGKLRPGYTTGACAAAAAKAAVMLLLGEERTDRVTGEVTIPFPDGNRVAFTARLNGAQGDVASASVIKDAGDDPDATNHAEIMAEVRFVAVPKGDSPMVRIEGGKGVGRVTKPGLSVSVGEPAINAVPRTMIREAVMEVIAGNGGLPEGGGIAITISVPKGEELAKKTLNARLGIAGGISILGTSGIVRPLSTEAWTATIAAAIDVAGAAGIREIVLSTGRVSEKAHMKRYGFPEEAYAMMGDHVEFSLRCAAEKGFAKVHLCAQWAKMLKISLSTPQTHVCYGAMDARKGMAHLNRLGIDLPGDRDFNTARDIFDYVKATKRNPFAIFRKVCSQAQRFAESVTGGTAVLAHLVSYEGEIIVDSG
jgi:cobalt-precorrin-5B (C1)-methyltransferase